MTLETDTSSKGDRTSRWQLVESDTPVDDYNLNLPTIIPSNLDRLVVEEYVVQFRLDEIAAKLRAGDVLPRYRERSVSPPPIYGPDGKRMNTREFRHKKKLQLERDRLIEKAQAKFQNFQPPADWRPPSRFVDKVYLPVKDFPLVNFIGLIIGPRGNTLKKMEAETGAKVSIRGKGSVKEGRIGGPQPQDEEELHCLLIADSQSKIDAAIAHINRIVELCVSTADVDNVLKRNQLRELASLNGTLRDDDARLCMHCGQPGHRRFECPERANANAANAIVCHNCGGRGHVSKDCLTSTRTGGSRGGFGEQLESEYAKFMQEVKLGSSSRDNTYSASSFQDGELQREATVPSVPPWKQQS